VLNYSAILTTYNAEKTLSKALNSILSQSILPSEVIVVDDFSSDSSYEVSKEIISTYCPIRIYKNSENLGVAHSRNFAVEKALQDNVVFFDDDDISLRERAEVHLGHFQLGANVSYVSSIKRYPSGHLVQNISDDFLGELSPQDCARMQFLGSNQLSLATPASCMAITKKQFLSVGGFDSELRRLEDADIFIRLASANASFAFTSVVGVERFDFGKPSSKFEGSSQKSILKKHHRFLTKREFQEAAFKVETRDLYFRKKVVRLMFRVLQQLVRNPRQIRYLFLGAKRVKHDWAKK
jgi:glycosyltransferase involved in cell wall biosynthesis